MNKKIIALLMAVSTGVTAIGTEVHQMHKEIRKNHIQEMEYMKMNNQLIKQTQWQQEKNHREEMNLLKKIEAEQDNKILEANKQLFHDVQQKIREQLGK